MLRYIEVVCVIIFTIEYLLRIYAAERKFKFIFSFYGIIDFLAILPFYLAIGVDLRSLRALRFLRLFRIFKLVRYNKALNHFSRAIKSAKEQIFLFIFITVLLIYFAAIGIYYFESKAQPEHFSSNFDSLWWAIITLTTVGYGDVYPITVGGKVFTSFILMIGLGIVAIPTGLFYRHLHILRMNLMKTVMKSKEGSNVWRLLKVEARNVIGTCFLDQF